ncbi:hypothetical protein RM572_00790 [Streptomyces sp. DSM 42041]|uniref:Uncharacterized protein n=1 Tax=Streptomyces hazeniae TaxID=3075538 RepID=A0ABU2NMN3_9ACTN|nr:hypothetical protein [Streptomyces sp. DSM 42041]MDT0377312.1 hypothetical protein [Streptomyces sp. DSM 42041]
MATTEKTSSSKRTSGLRLDPPKLWNNTADRPPAPPRDVERPGACTVEKCGTVAPAKGGRAPDGLVRVHLKTSREPARWYCEGLCAHYGTALAELRPAGWWKP